MQFGDLPTVHATTLRRYTRSSSHPGVHQNTDVMVTADGRLRVPPIYAAVSRCFELGTATRWRRHDSIEIVCLMVSGTLACEYIDGSTFALGAEDVAVVSTSSGLEYRWRSIGDEPARGLFFWLPARPNRAPRHTQYHAPRAQRIGELVALAGIGTPAPITAPITVHSVVMASGTSLTHAAGHRRCYIVPTLGPIAVEGVVAGPNSGVVGEGGVRTICALESTEVVIVET